MKRFWFGLIFIVLIAGVAIGFYLLKPQPLIPATIRQQVTSTIFMPSGSNVVNIKDTAKYDTKLKLLSYRTTIFGINAVVSEQPTPQTFTDIPQAYDKVLQSWNQYDSFDSAQGTVYLTKPKNNGNKEVGVMNSKGTLMFVTADKDLSGDQWRLLFKNLQISS